jgi:peptidoglycan-N-acetylglucosamine deacetylase
VNSPAYLTTSWDDGHPLDLRLADLLQRYGIPATFYVPLNSFLPVMEQSAIREMASREFEIGGHTVNHVDLLFVDDRTAKAEIAQCKNALEDITGTACRTFCFPKGHFRRRHLRLVLEAGFSAVRTVELMSVALPKPQNGITVLPTTIQAAPTSALEYAKNFAKRGAYENCLNYLRYRGRDWAATAEAFLQRVAVHGGVFHLWGHSWEIEERGEWARLERVFAAIAMRRQSFQFVTNHGLPVLDGIYKVNQ